MNKQGNSGGSFFTGAIIGGLLGAVAGLLLAPKAGTETVEMLKESSSQWREKGQTMLEEEVSSLRETVTEMQEVIREALEEGREVFREVMDEGKEVSSKTASEMHSQFNAAKETATKES